VTHSVKAGPGQDVPFPNGPDYRGNVVTRRAGT
jgi:hypothetical protein